MKKRATQVEYRTALAWWGFSVIPSQSYRAAPRLVTGVYAKWIGYRRLTHRAPRVSILRAKNDVAHDVALKDSLDFQD